MKVAIIHPAVSQDSTKESNKADHSTGLGLGLGLGHVTVVADGIDRESSGLGHITIDPNGNSALYSGRVDIIDWIRGRV
ncbi:MAG: hypothetical protein COS89_05745 [Deltaproteobacteria bacterium CG07_land_8_20_14_0_80_38_7]|nr:MAG: hypothetical protein COS89_05745 [Deltaproteobacteria bacterium CG07_land_8_20_14_0_80_38_7]